MLSVIIPAKDEEEAIVDTIQQNSAHLGRN